MSARSDTERDSDEKEAFVQRWSRRKQQSAPAQTSTHRAEKPQAELTPAARQVLTDADMPDIETLDAGSDFAGFLSPGVSEALRTRALRRLFHMAGLHTPDGLDDYDEDFTALSALGDSITHDMQRMLAREKQPSAPASGTVEDTVTRSETDPAHDLPEDSGKSGHEDPDDNTEQPA